MGGAHADIANASMTQTAFGTMVNPCPGVDQSVYIDSVWQHEGRRYSPSFGQPLRLPSPHDPSAGGEMYIEIPKQADMISGAWGQIGLPVLDGDSNSNTDAHYCALAPVVLVKEYKFRAMGQDMDELHRFYLIAYFELTKLGSQDLGELIMDRQTLDALKEDSQSRNGADSTYYKYYYVYLPFYWARSELPSMSLSVMSVQNQKIEIFVQLTDNDYDLFQDDGAALSNTGNLPNLLRTGSEFQMSDIKFHIVVEFRYLCDAEREKLFDMAYNGFYMVVPTVRHTIQESLTPASNKSFDIQSNIPTCSLITLYHTDTAKNKNEWGDFSNAEYTGNKETDPFSSVNLKINYNERESSNVDPKWYRTAVPFAMGAAIPNKYIYVDAFSPNGIFVAHSQGAVHFGGVDTKTFEVVFRSTSEGADATTGAGTMHQFGIGFQVQCSARGGIVTRFR